MSVDLSIQDTTDKSGSYAKFFGYDFPATMKNWSSSHVQNLLISESGFVQTNLFSVSLVAFTRNPFQVINSIISLNAIFMVNFTKVFRIRN